MTDSIRVRMTPSHPGEFIRAEILDELGLSVTEAAKLLGVRRATLSDLLNGKSSLSPEMALRIEKEFNIGMNMLLRMQAWHDVARMGGHSGPTSSQENDQRLAGPQLTSRQRDVIQALGFRESEQYRLSNWYLGALYAIHNRQNPDRIAQAAQSLRELLEKLPRVFQDTPIQVNNYDFRTNQRDLRAGLSKALERYSGNWNGQEIDTALAKTLNGILNHFEQTNRPSRREQVGRAVALLDPLVHQFDPEIQRAKRDVMYDLWQQMEKFAHHGNVPDEESFNECLDRLEQVVFELLAPISARDQSAIRSILDRSSVSESEVEEMLSLIERRGANYSFFFTHASDPSWMSILDEKGYFSNPPNAEPEDDGTLILPNWWPIRYLSRIAGYAPEEVAELVLRLPLVDNARVYDSILDIAIVLPGETSANLKPKLLEYTELPHQLLPHKYGELLAHWAKEGQCEAALEIADRLVRFLPDPQSELKRQRHKANPEDWTTMLRSSPRFEEWDYRKILEQGVMPLLEKEPCQTALLLIDVVSEMIDLGKHEEEFGQDSDEDASEIWCPRLGEKLRRDADSEVAIAVTLTAACENVFENDPTSIADLDDALSAQRWKLFKRLRQHLFALYPNEQTKPWIRDLIVDYESYSQWEYGYELQRMIHSACNYFGEEMLTLEERKVIFDSILSGPSRELYRNWVGESFNEEDFAQFQDRFHRKQLWPFASVLFGEYKTRFQVLGDASVSDLSDSDFSPVGEIRTGTILPRSPQSPSELAERTDEELLNFINEWDSEHRDEENRFVEVTIEALADAFRTAFRDSILPDDERLGFWLDGKERIQRPIYVRAITGAMQEYISGGNNSRLRETFDFCGWVLSHPDGELRGGFEREEKSRENPIWNSSRRAVCDLLEACVSEDVSLPGIFGERLASLLELLCTQFDWRLDAGRRVLPDREDQYAEAINNTRSIALQTLIRFGLWMRKTDLNSDISEVTRILENRFSTESDIPLALPERAALAVSYPNLLYLDEAWSIEHRTDFFPQDDLQQWHVAFVSLLRRTYPHPKIFEVLSEEFERAVKNLSILNESDDWGERVGYILGMDLMAYYMWGMFPLEGEGGLLSQYYRKIERHTSMRSDIFRRVGANLQDTNEPLDERTASRLVAFVEWRLEGRNFKELEGFDYWLEADCLDIDWRLHTYLRILEIGQPEGWEVYGHVKALHGLLNQRTAKVVKCFAKLTSGSQTDASHITAEVAGEIILAGLESDDDETQRHAEIGRDNLLSRGVFGLLDVHVRENE